jgi:hypothetical protein
VKVCIHSEKFGAIIRPAEYGKDKAHERAIPPEDGIQARRMADAESNKGSVERM